MKTAAFRPGNAPALDRSTPRSSRRSHASLTNRPSKNCQAFPPRYESVSPHSTTLPRPTSPTNLADYIAELGILKIGGKKFFCPVEIQRKGRRMRPFRLSERRSSMPPSATRATARQHDLGTAPRRRSQCCQACQQMQVLQNQLPATCPRRKTQNAPTKSAQQAKPPSPANPACKTTAPPRQRGGKDPLEPLTQSTTERGSTPPQALDSMKAGGGRTPWFRKSNGTPEPGARHPVLNPAGTRSSPRTHAPRTDTPARSGSAPAG